MASDRSRLLHDPIQTWQEEKTQEEAARLDIIGYNVSGDEYKVCGNTKCKIEHSQSLFLLEVFLVSSDCWIEARALFRRKEVTKVHITLCFVLLIAIIAIRGF